MLHKMKLKYGDFELDLEGERDFVENRSVDMSAIVTMLIQKNEKKVDNEQKSNQESRLEIQTNTITEESRVKKISFVEFLSSKNFKNDVDLVLGTGYYIEEIERKGSFTSKEITEYLRKAKQQSPKNISLCFTGNTKKGFLLPLDEKVDGKLAYEISQSGIDYIEKYKPLEKNGKNKTRKPKDKQENLEVLKFSIDKFHLEKYCDIHKITRTEDRALMILKIFSAECGMPALSIDEIETILREKFSIPVTYDSIKSALRNSKPKVEGLKIDGKLRYRLMAPGNTYINDLIQQVSNGE